MSTGNQLNLSLLTWPDHKLPSCHGSCASWIARLFVVFKRHQNVETWGLRRSENPHNLWLVSVCLQLIFSYRINKILPESKRSSCFLCWREIIQMLSRCIVSIFLYIILGILYVTGYLNSMERTPMKPSICSLLIRTFSQRVPIWIGVPLTHTIHVQFIHPYILSYKTSTQMEVQMP